MYRDREDAGRKLAEKLAALRGQDVVVLGLPRGGVVVALPVAEALGAPLDVLVARKIGAPDHEEFAIGAVTARGTRVLHEELLRRYLLPPGYLERATDEQRKVAEYRETAFRGNRPMVPIRDKIAILVDDGIATGMTMFAAIEDAKAERPASLIVAAPVIAPSTFEALKSRVDRVVALEVPEPFYAVGQFYEDFAQTTDEEVQQLLSATTKRG